MSGITDRSIPFARSVSGWVLLAVALSVAFVETLIWFRPGLFLGTGPTLWLVLPVIVLVAVLGCVIEGAVPWWALAPALVLSAVYLYTGLVMPWNQLSYVVATTVSEGLLAVPVVGDHLVTALFGGYSPSRATLRNAQLLHYAIVAGINGGAVAAMAGSHLRSMRGGGAGT